MINRVGAPSRTGADGSAARRPTELAAIALAACSIIPALGWAIILVAGLIDYFQTTPRAQGDDEETIFFSLIIGLVIMAAATLGIRAWMLRHRWSVLASPFYLITFAPLAVGTAVSLQNGHEYDNLTVWPDAFIALFGLMNVANIILATYLGAVSDHVERNRALLVGFVGAGLAVLALFQL